jgi:anti-anti-sigma factor
MEVKKSEINGISVFEFNWELDETNADTTFTGIYNEIGDFEDKKIIFNMTGLKYLNSKSIGYIADIYGNIEDNDWEMAICSCDEGVKDVLELVWITTIIETFDSLEEAVESLS